MKRKIAYIESCIQCPDADIGYDETMVIWYPSFCNLIPVEKDKDGNTKKLGLIPTDKGFRSDCPLEDAPEAKSET